MQNKRGEMWINRKDAARRLAVDPPAHAKHLLGKARLVFEAAHVLNGGIRKRQVHRLIGQRQFAPVSDYERQIASFIALFRRPDIDDYHALLASDASPDAVAAPDVGDGAAGGISFGESAEASRTEKTTHRFLKVVGIPEFHF